MATRLNIEPPRTLSTVDKTAYLACFHLVFLSPTQSYNLFRTAKKNWEKLGGRIEREKHTYYDGGSIFIFFFRLKRVLASWAP